MAWSTVVCGLLLVYSAAVCLVILTRRSYVEIDFVTYLVQAQGTKDYYSHLAGMQRQEDEEQALLYAECTSPFDYTCISGPSGPCVYPGGHLLVHSLLAVAVESVVPADTHCTIEQVYHNRSTHRTIDSHNAVAGHSDPVSDTTHASPPHVSQSRILSTDDASSWPCIRYYQTAMFLLFVVQAAISLLLVDRVLGWPSPRSSLAFAGQALLCLLWLSSLRTKSLYVLRAFNDCWAALFGNLGLLALSSTSPTLTRARVALAVATVSLSVSIKMSWLLVLPALGIAALSADRSLPRAVAWCAAVALAVQAVMGAPYLATNATEYLRRAFDFSRDFEYVWSVNWQMLPEDVFHSPAFHRSLLAAHAGSLLTLGWRRWGLRDILPSCLGIRPSTVHLTPTGAVFVAVECVFVGLVFARSLHYQFYVTYYWTLPLLVVSATQHRWLPQWATVLLRLALVGAIEWSFLAYPTRASASTVLAAAHSVLFVSMFTSSLPRGAIRRSASENKKYA